jgi:hypothetical protein
MGGRRLLRALRSTGGIQRLLAISGVGKDKRGGAIRRSSRVGGAGWAQLFLTSSRMPPPPPSSQIEVDLNSTRECVVLRLDYGKSAGCRCVTFHNNMS